MTKTEKLALIATQEQVEHELTAAISYLRSVYRRLRAHDRDTVPDPLIEMSHITLAQAESLQTHVKSL